MTSPLETTCQIKATNGGKLDSYSGDNPEAIYGDAYHRVVIDEASRQSEKSLVAALTTISATAGKVRLAFNLERGAKNWAIRNLLRVRHMTPEERTRHGEDFMMFPTAPEGFVDHSLIDQLRSKMPLAVWEALYEAKIPEDDAALFRNLDRIFSGAERSEPEPGHRYLAGIDLARKADWTVMTMIDQKTGAVVAMDRFHEISWSLQYERCVRSMPQPRRTTQHEDGRLWKHGAARRETVARVLAQMPPVRV